MRLIVLALSATLAGGCVVVVAGTCEDGIQNENETDIDCGGPHCAPCPVGDHCIVASDCATGLCTAGVCVTPIPAASCSDGVKNGNETDVDCGGSCSPCAGGRVCATNNDCQSQVCTGSVCTPHPTGADTAPTSANEIDQVAIGAGFNAPATGGYAITANTGTYRLVASAPPSSAGTLEFYGSLFTTGGISSINVGCGGMCSLAAPDYVSQPYAIAGGQRIDFDFVDATSLSGDGFDILVNSSTVNTPMIFDLFINGQPATAQTVFASTATQQRTPGTMPFGLHYQ